MNLLKARESSGRAEGPFVDGCAVEVNVAERLGESLDAISSEQGLVAPPLTLMKGADLASLGAESTPLIAGAIACDQQ